jgi:leader peptidase (prepilin peptidase)/N-methyltransferase
MRGRARCCGARVSARYPLVEAIGGLLSMAILETIVLRLDPSTSAARAVAIYAADLALALGMVAAAFIDLEFMILPEAITLGGTVLGIATASFREMRFVDAILGGAIGFAIVWLPFVKLYPKLRGRAGMGLGDACLLMLAGAWFGWQGALTVLGAGAVQGTLVAIPVLLLRGRIDEPEEVVREREEARRELEGMTAEEREAAEKELAEDPLADEPGPGLGGARMAFGPFLALATIECLLFRSQLTTWNSWLWPT